MQVYLKGHQNFQKSNIFGQKSPLLLSKIESLNLRLLVVLMLLEEKPYTVPHLKALSSGIEAFRSHGIGGPFLDTTAI